MTDTIIVLGKRTVRQSEIPHLQTIGIALQRRDKQLITTSTEGVASIVAAAYASAGGTPQYMTNDNYKELTEKHPIIAFTDLKYQQQLDKSAPDWRTAGWMVIHNPKATEEAATYLTQLLAEWETPIEVSP